MKHSGNEWRAASTVILLTLFPTLAQSAEEERSPASIRKTAASLTQSATRDSQAQPPVPTSPLEEEDRLTKNWGGPRKRLSDLGIDIAIIYKGELNRNLEGGLSKGGTYLGNLDLRLSLDGEKLGNRKGLSAFVYGLANHGGRPSQRVGDAQVTSNIETAANAFKLYEAWAQQILFDEKFSVLAGLHDLNSEFYATEASGLFLNSSFGVGKELSQTGLNGPSIFPVTAPAIRVRVEPTKSLYLESAVFGAKAGDPNEPRGTHVSISAEDGYLAITELAYQAEGAKYGLGFWTYTSLFDHQSQTIEAAEPVPAKATNRGVYLLGSQPVTRQISVFARYGIASGEVNEFVSCLGVGGVWTGALPGRDKDRLGFAIARSATGGEYQSARRSEGLETDTAETAYELTYRMELIPGIAIQPDFQYVSNPSADPSISDAKVAALRFEISF